MTPFGLPPVPRHLLLATALVLGLAFRAVSLDTYGFSEDETAKLRAIQAYEAGNFSANAEHPMLLKLAMWGALTVGDAATRAGVAVAPEAALRWPNILAGTATIAFVAGAAALLFSPLIGIVAALLVAFDPNVIAVNRLGKEDTFLVLFFFVAVWSYERAKRIGEHDAARARRWYNVAGAAFGLMLASKYLPHLLGLYALFNVTYQRHAGANAPDKPRYYASMLGAFVAANFAILSPATWRYCLEYLHGEHLTHHGFNYAGTLYATDLPLSLSGVPVTYYFDMLATKTSLPVLLAALAGLVPLFTRRERGFAWMRVLLLVQLFGYSLVAAKFQRYSLSILLLVDILAAVGIVTMMQWLAGIQWPRPVARAAMVALPATVIAAAVAAAASASPYYSINQNLLGAQLAPPATTFPEESYDYGVREAVGEIARHARSHADVISDAPGVVAHYVSATGRSDLRVLSLSQAGLGGRGERWVIVQDGHLYFENRAAVAQLRRTRRAWRQYRLGQTAVLELFHIPGPPAARTPEVGARQTPEAARLGSS